MFFLPYVGLGGFIQHICIISAVSLSFCEPTNTTQIVDTEKFKLRNTISEKMYLIAFILTHHLLFPLIYRPFKELGLKCLIATGSQLKTFLLLKDLFSAAGGEACC